MTGKKVVKMEYDYCGLCPFLGELILADDLEINEYKSIIYCTGFHGVGMVPIVRELTREEYENIPDWCPRLMED